MKLTETGFLLSASDLMSFAGCRHLTELERKLQEGRIDEPKWAPPNLMMLRKKGEEHEQAYIEYLSKQQGKEVFECKISTNEATLQAMKQGFDIITQAYLSNGHWRGYSDVLRKVDGKSDLGDYYYEVEDTKLAQETKATTVLQLCLYTELLSDLQGRVSEKMTVVKPGIDFPREEFRYAEFEAYYRRLKKDFEEVIDAGTQPTYPLPVTKCNTCRWWQICDRQWEDDDHLSRVAGAGLLQIREIEERGFDTLQAWAEAQEEDVIKKPVRGSVETYQKLHGQADIQLRGRRQSKMLHELLDFEENAGLNRLPTPDPGDVYFDIEGDRYFEGQGIEYLFGYAYKNESGELEYKAIWAKNRDQEKEMFESFMDFLEQQWREFPGFHIYHYAPYEPTTIKKLAGIYGTREAERDKLLRAERFIDLYSILKESLRASVTSYSLKQTEKLAGFTREVDLRDASAARRQLSTSFELDSIDKYPPENLHIIEGYNRDDVIATERLHMFLEGEYQKNVKKRGLSRPELKDGDPSEKIIDEMDLMEKISIRLKAELPDDRSKWSAEHHAKWLLAHQLDFFHRERNARLWEYFEMRNADIDELLEHRKAIVYLKFQEEFPPEGRERTPTHRYSFPVQEMDISAGEEVIDKTGIKIGTIRNIDWKERFIDIKKTGKTVNTHPEAVILNVRSHDGREENFISVVDQLSIIDWKRNDNLKAVCDILLRHQPDLVNSGFGQHYKDAADKALQLCKALNSSYLPIQGPPGTGKTYSGASIILELASEGKRVGITALSHAAIRNLIDKIIELSRDRGIPVNLAHKPGSISDDLPEELVEVTNNAQALSKLDEGFIVGATTYLWSREEASEKLDYLFIDEAGQLSLTAVIASARASKNIVLLGDQQQLEQPTQASHPEESGISAMNYILAGKKTIPDDRGVFLNVTYRLPEKLTQFTSDLYYESRLNALETLRNQQINGNGTFSGSGLLYHPSTHQGNQSRSLEEVEEVVTIYNRILSENLSWTDRDEITRDITNQDILIIAPYNSQVNAIKERIENARVGTVDKFQGQEAPIVIYSMTSSSAEDSPRGMGFLYDPHRFNVATSRTQCICILIASPKLFEAECHSISQMRMANGLCRYRELAKELIIE